MPTNYNKKLGCNYMVHVDLAPSQTIPETVLQNTVIEIRTKDESHPPSRWKLEDLCRLPLNQLTSSITWPSHGQQSFEFAKWFLENNTGTGMQTAVAIYYYRKITG